MLPFRLRQVGVDLRGQSPGLRRPQCRALVQIGGCCLSAAWWLAPVLVLLAWPYGDPLPIETAVAAAAEPAETQSATSGQAARALPHELAMAERVDRLLAERWASEGVTPAPLADDATFLRRARLDLCGSIPSVAEVRQFLADPSPEKRAALIDRLLAHPDHAAHLADAWSNFLLPGDADPARLGGALGFQGWLRLQFAQNRRYDNVVADLLVASGGANQLGPALFYLAQDAKPEELAANTSRLFLGIQIQCAQCHDHPFNAWKKRDFWGYAAFFAQVRQQTPRGGSLQVIDVSTGEVRLPDTDTVVRPKFLDAAQATVDEDDVRRRQLAIWLVARDNPYFARATVNRVWSHLFGRGLVEPVDDLGSHNPPSHPQLLDELSQWFTATGYDLRALFRTLANTQAYQRSSELQADLTEPRPELFARAAIKSLSAEQWYDCLAKASLRPLPATPGLGLAGALNDPERQSFLVRFRQANRQATEFQAGIPQALALMNGGIIRQATDLETSQILEAVAAPWFGPDEQLEILSLATLSRVPTDAERQQFGQHLRSAAEQGSLRRGLADLLWALLNSAEFALNH